MPGLHHRKTITECSDREIRAFLIAGTGIAAAIDVVSFWSDQPDWFLWPLRLFCVVWIAWLWYRAIRELRGRKRGEKPVDPARAARTRMSAPVMSCDPFERLIVSLRADGLAGDADRLHDLIHKVAWTTGSELMGELGQEIRKLRREHGDRFSANTRNLMDAALQMVERVWPDFPR